MLELSLGTRYCGHKYNLPEYDTKLAGDGSSHTQNEKVVRQFYFVIWQYKAAHNIRTVEQSIKIVLKVQSTVYIRRLPIFISLVNIERPSRSSRRR